LKLRSNTQLFIDFVTFPVRALLIFEDDRWGLSSLKTERFDHVAREVKGYCLDVGCGRQNRFVNRHLDGNGKGIDVYKYDGLTDDQIVEDITHFPFADTSFESVTFIGNINHIPKSMRDTELAEAYRVAKPGGNVVITMGNPFTEVLVHHVVALYDRFLGTNLDVDGERGMHHEESYFLSDGEIKGRLAKAGFTNIKKKYFFTEWCLNHLFVGWKS